MSADTSIVIVKFLEWWRHTDVIQAAENLLPKRYKTDKKRKEVIRIYDRSKPFNTYASCMKSASKVQQEYEDNDDFWMELEYWIVDFGTYNFTLYEESNPRDLQAQMEDYMKSMRGERCKDPVRWCQLCKAWAAFDYLFKYNDDFEESLFDDHQ